MGSSSSSGAAVEFARVGQELPRDRVGGIVGVDQGGERRRHAIA